MFVMYKIVLCGGWDGGSNTDSIEMYDIASNTWEMSNVKLPLSMEGFFCDAV